MTATVSNTKWRATGPYRANNASKAGILEETSIYLSSYVRTHSPAATRAELLNGALAQKSRAGRDSILSVIEDRLVRWQPPYWVIHDLAAFAADYDRTSLKAALLLHAVRQDSLLNDFVQNVIVPRWEDGDHLVTRSDVQGFLDSAEPEHPEVNRWSVQTREKLAGNALSILRDYGLLEGGRRKTIIEPTVPNDVVAHLVKLLQEEGVPTEEIPYHRDWRIWLMDPERVTDVLAEITTRGLVGGNR